MEDSNVNVVLVTGITGLPVWASGQKTPMSFLASKFPQARINVFHTIEHNLQLAEKYATDAPNLYHRALALIRYIDTNVRTDDKGEKSDKTRCIVAGHDIGGLVVKQALVIADTEPYYEWATRLIYANLFFETLSIEPDLRLWENHLVWLLGDASTRLSPCSFLHYVPSFGSQLEDDFRRLLGSYEMTHFVRSTSPLRFINKTDQEQNMIQKNQTVLPDSDKLDSWLMEGHEPAVAIICETIKNYVNAKLDDPHEANRRLLRSLTEMDPHWHRSRSSIDLSGSAAVNSWITQTLWYPEWIGSPDNAVLHLVGPSGSGLTLLVSEVVRLLSENASPVISFAFSDGEQRVGHSSISTLFHSLCRQMLQLLLQSRSRFALCTWVVNEGIFTKEVLKAILCSLVSSYAGDPLFCIVHRTQLLEKKQQEELIQDLESVRQSNQSCFKLLFTSNEHEAWHDMPQPYEFIDILKEQEQFGVIQYLATARIDRLTVTQPAWRHSTQREAAIEKLCTTSTTVFELTQKLEFLESDDILEIVSAVDSRIKGIPSSVEGILTHNLERVYDGSGRFLAISALPWILEACRPLSLAELAVCTAFSMVSEATFTLTSLTLNMSWNPARDIRRSLGHLIHIVGDEVQIHHQSYAAILRNGSHFQLHRDIHLNLFSQCLKYLHLISETWTPTMTCSSGSEAKRENQFAEYATLYWPHHYLLAEDKHSAAKHAYDFLRNRDQFEPWLRMLSHFSTLRKQSTRLPNSPLNVASYYGLLEVVEMFVNEEPPLDDIDQQLLLGLELASENGHTAVVDLVLAKGPNTSTGNALRIAARLGHIRIVLALLDNMASEIDTRDDQGYSAFLEACRGGHVDIVFNLLQKEVDVNSMNKNKTSALHMACRIGQQDIVQKLIDSGAHRAEKDTFGYTPLMYAAEGGFDRILQALLSTQHKEDDRYPPKDQSVVNLNCGNMEGNTAMHIAVLGGHRKMVKMLIENKGDPAAENNINYTPLHLAAELGFLDIVKDLIHLTSKQSDSVEVEEEATVDSEYSFNTSTPSPLKLAVKSQNLSVIKELLMSKQHMSKASASEAMSFACKSGLIEPVLEILRWHHDLAEDDSSLTDSNGNTALHIALESGRCKLVDEIISSKLVPLDAVNEDGWAPLHVAAKAGDANAIKALVVKGASLRAINSRKRTPLHIAAAAGHREACKELRSESVDVARMEDDDGATPVFLAAQEDHLEVVADMLKFDKERLKGGLLHMAVGKASDELMKLVLTTEPDLNWTNDFGKTAVHLAVTRKRTSMIRELHSAGANMTTKDNQGRTPFFLAVQSKDVEVINALLDLDCDLTPDEQDNDGFTPLLAVCRYFFMDEKQVTDVVRVLLERCPGINVNIINKDSGRTPLHFSTDGEEEELTTLLLDAGAHPNIQNKRGSTPLFLAAEMGKAQSVMTLIERGAEVDITNSSNSTALHRAAGHGQAACIKVLVEKSADVNIRSSRGYTPVALVAKNGYLPGIKEFMVVKDKIDFSIKDTDDFTILGLAIEEEQDDIVDELIKEMPKTAIDRTMRDESLNGHSDVVSTLLNHGVGDANLEDDMFGSILGAAVVKQRTGLVGILLGDANIKVDSHDGGDRTPLTYAIILENLSLVEALLEAGADPNWRDNEDMTPIVWAIRTEEPGLVKALIDSEKVTLDLEQVDGRGRTLLYWACRSSEDRIFDVVNGAVKNLPVYSSMCKQAIHASIASNNKTAFLALLENPNIDLTSRDQDGWTPLDIAKCYERTDMEEKITEKLGDMNSEVVVEGDFKPASRWHLTDNGRGLSVTKKSPNFVRVSKNTYAISDEDVEYGVARADHCMPRDCDWYFEVEIKKDFQEGSQALGIGLCEDNASLNYMLGFGPKKTYGYHADDGGVYPSDEWIMETGESYGKDDFVGCGFDKSINCIYFTRNGKYLGPAFRDIKSKVYPAVFMNTREIGVCVSANFQATNAEGVRLWKFDEMAPKWPPDSGPSRARTVSPEGSPDMYDSDIGFGL